jgi:hypothetical protein
VRVDANAPSQKGAEQGAIRLVEEHLGEHLAPPWRVMKSAQVQFPKREPALQKPERVSGIGEEENGPLGVDLALERRIERFRDGDDAAAGTFRNPAEIEIGAIGFGPKGIGDDGEERGMKGVPPAMGHLAVDQPVVDARQEERHLRG